MSIWSITTEPEEVRTNVAHARADRWFSVLGGEKYKEKDRVVTAINTGNIMRSSLILFPVYACLSLRER